MKQRIRGIVTRMSAKATHLVGLIFISASTQLHATEIPIWLPGLGNVIDTAQGTTGTRIAIIAVAIAATLAYFNKISWSAFGAFVFLIALVFQAQVFVEALKGF